MVRIPLQMNAIRRELTYYVAWYNLYQPYSYLAGSTAQEAYEGLVPANSQPRLEPLALAVR